MTETLGGSVRLTGLHGIMHVCVFWCVYVLLFPHGGYPVVFALVSRRYQRFFLALCSVIFSSCSSSLSPVSMVTEASQTSLPLRSCRACGASTRTLRRRIQTLPGSPDHLQDRRGERVRGSEREKSVNLILDKNQEKKKMCKCSCVGYMSPCFLFSKRPPPKMYPSAKFAVCWLVAVTLTTNSKTFSHKHSHLNFSKPL